MRRLRLVLAGLVGYLLGSIPTADLASRAATRGRVDLREAGSGNPGAANVRAVLGNHWGAAVLAGDMAKGTVAGLAGRAIGGDDGAYVAATASVAGHIWPPWSGFRGGKGVATSSGAVLAVFPAYFLVDGAVVALSVVSTRRAEASMWITAPVWVVGAYVWWKRDWPNLWGPRPSSGMFWFAAATTAMILAKFSTTRD